MRIKRANELTSLYSLSFDGPSRVSIIPVIGTFGCGLPRDLTPGDYDAPVFSLGGQDDYAFSPDGTGDLLRSNHDRDAGGFDQQRFVYRAREFSGGRHVCAGIAATKNITADNKAADETPLYSPDGKYIAYRAQARPGYESDRFG